MMSHVLVHTEFNKSRFENELTDDFIVATDVAEYLVSKGVPFREAHSCTGKLVAYAIENQKSLAELTLDDYRKFHSLFEADITERIQPHTSVEMKISSGSTSPNEIKKQIVHWTRALKQRKI
jgi:argininosuccinate lyase